MSTFLACFILYKIWWLIAGRTPLNHILVLINDLVVTVWHAGHVGLSDHLHLAHMPGELWVEEEQACHRFDKPRLNEQQTRTALLSLFTRAVS